VPIETPELQLVVDVVLAFVGMRGRAFGTARNDFTIVFVPARVAAFVILLNMRLNERFQNFSEMRFAMIFTVRSSVTDR